MHTLMINGKLLIILHLVISQCTQIQNILEELGGRFDYRDAYYAPLFSYVNPNDRIGYLNMSEDNGVVPFTNNGSIDRLD